MKNDRYLDSLAREKDQLDTARVEGQKSQQKITITVGYKNGLSIDLLAKLTNLNEEQVIHILKKAGLYKS